MDTRMSGPFWTPRSSVRWADVEREIDRLEARDKEHEKSVDSSNPDKRRTKEKSKDNKDGSSALISNKGGLNLNETKFKKGITHHDRPHHHHHQRKQRLRKPKRN